MDYAESTAYMEKIGLNPKSWTNHVIVAEALKRGLNVAPGKRTESFEVTDSTGRRLYWRRGASNLNNLAIQRITEHKAACSSLLQAYGAPGTVNAVFTKGEASRAWLWAEKFKSVVVKPANGIHGKNVHVDITTLEEFLVAFDDVVNAASGKVLVEEFYRGTEHRCLVVGQKLVGVIYRRPANVVGDGISNIEELVHEKNQHRAPIHKKMVLNSAAEKLLAKSGLTKYSVPADGERVFIKRISNGGDFIDATETLSETEIETIEDAARVLAGGSVLGFDVLLPREEDRSEVKIIEVNSNPMISMHHFPWEGKARDVASQILDLRFSS